MPRAHSARTEGEWSYGELILDEERSEIASLVDTVLERKLGYRCVFAVVWVQAEAAPVMAGYATNMSTADTVSLLQQTIDSLENIR